MKNMSRDSDIKYEEEHERPISLKVSFIQPI